MGEYIPSKLCFDMATTDGRLIWARELIRHLDTSGPLPVPDLPYDLRGCSESSIEALRRSPHISPSDRATINRFMGWRGDVLKARARNRLTLWSLLRMLQVFGEKKETAGERALVERFLAQRWELGTEDQTWALGQRLQQSAGVIANG